MHRVDGEYTQVGIKVRVVAKQVEGERIVELLRGILISVLYYEYAPHRLAVVFVGYFLRQDKT